MKKFNPFTKTILLILWLLLVLPSCNQPKTAENLNEYLQLSQNAYNAKDYVEYCRLTSKLVDLEPILAGT